MVADGLAQSLDVLRALGATMREVTIADYDPTRTRLAGFLISEAEGAFALYEEMAATPAALSEDFRRMLVYGRDVLAAKLVQAQRLVAEAGLAVRRLFNDVELPVTPMAPQLAFPFKADPPENQADYTAIGNFGRCTAVSVPCGLSHDGLPVAVQILAPPFEEACYSAWRPRLKLRWERCQHHRTIHNGSSALYGAFCGTESMQIPSQRPHDRSSSLHESRNLAVVNRTTGALPHVAAG